MKRFILSLLSALIGLTAMTAQNPSDEAVAAARKAPRNRVAQRTAGDALYDEGRYKEAISFYLKADNAGNYGAARAAFRLYNFSTARDYLDRYLAKRTKAERERDIASEGGFEDPTELLSSKITLGEDMLGRVEKIEVIDSVNVPADEFFTWMRLAASAGTIASGDMIEEVVTPSALNDDEYIVTPGYLTEDADCMLWAKADAGDNVTLYETTRLVDGSWGEPLELFSHASLFDDDADGSFVGHPFLMPDGVTLYFAADGDRSLGGLDIFMSRRDERGFLQPSNIGMPYNSPFNDYMLAIDEETGAGWWASDRNQLDDSVTIYTFIPSEVRVNYPTDQVNLTQLARLTDISLTLNSDANHASLRRKIAAIKPQVNTVSRKKGPEFRIAMPDGRILTRFSDFTSSIAREAMQDYLDAEKTQRTNLKRLASLREQYAKGDRSVADEILSLEQQVEQEGRHLIELRNQVINSEI